MTSTFKIFGKNLPKVLLPYIDVHSIFEVEKYARETRYDLDYMTLTGTDRENAFLEALRKIDSQTLNKAGIKKQQIWQEGWAENLQMFIENPRYESLIPKFYKKAVMRAGQDLLVSEDPLFRFYLWDLLTTWVFKKFLGNYKTIVEYGAGTGYNLVKLAEFFPEARLFGGEWVSSGIELMNRVGKEFKIPITGFYCDMFNPAQQNMFHENPNINLKDAAVLTLGSMEQMGNNFTDFAHHLIKSKPGLVLHMEPVREYYQKNTLLDYVCMKFHDQRNYLGNYLTFLKNHSDVEIVYEQPIEVGTIYQMSWNILVWKTKN